MWHLVILAGLVALWVGAWVVLSRRAAPPRPGNEPPDGPSFPRCRTCGRWPGPASPCSRTGNPEEATDGCRHHTSLEARAAARSEA